MRELLNTRFIIAGLLVVVAVLVALSAWSVHHAKNSLHTEITQTITDEIENIKTLATLTDNNGADAVTARIVADCARRVKFESLLSRLDELDQKELITVQQLFESCGGFFAERKALMVLRLENEVAFLAQNVALLHTLDENEPYSASLQDWQELVALEKERSGLLTDRVSIQQNIITNLMRGKTLSSKNMKDLSSRAMNISERLAVVNTRIDTMREELLNE